MERIKLNKNEKAVFRWLLTHNGYKATMLRPVFESAVRGLVSKGLVTANWSEEAGLVEAHLTDYGEGYIADNPKLYNPLDWKWLITAFLSAVTAVAAVLSALFSCGVVAPCLLAVAALSVCNMMLNFK